MPLKDYGVWVAYPISYKAERDSDDPVSPHISLYYDNTPDVQRGQFRAAINVKSSTRESRLAYWFVRNFDEPILEYLQTLDTGFHSLSSGEKLGLDYIRGNLMKFGDGTLVNHDVEGEKNDIIDYVSPILDQAIEQKAKIFLFGEPFPNGIHDVHMNQGNEGRFTRDNGVYQDGGIIIGFPDGHFEAIFLAFAVQKIHTDDKTGDPIGDTDFAELLEREPPSPVKPLSDGTVYIKAALVNPFGPDGTSNKTPEVIYLNNRTTSVINLDGWAVVNRQGQTQRLNGELQPLSDQKFAVPDCPLSNRGDTITLLNGDGLKVDGVSYTARQAAREGRLLYFH